jgi:predicted dehydrogenase
MTQPDDTDNLKQPSADEAQSKNTSRVSRRKFLAVAGLATSGTVGAYYLTRRSIPVAIIGAGVRGSELAMLLRYLSYVASPYGDVRAICDVSQHRADEMRLRDFPTADVYQDYRRVLERDDVEAVIIATPDHWHAQIAIEAMKSGKAIYCEKPLSLTVAEGQKLMATSRETDVVFQIGTQQRHTTYFRTACELLRNGRLGKLRSVDITLDENQHRLDAPCHNKTVPTDLNWNLFLGPAPYVDYCDQKYNHWSNYWDYAGGMMTNWGSHHLDIAHWGIGDKAVRPIRFSGTGEVPFDHDGGTAPRSFSVTIDYRGGLKITIRSVGKKDAKGILFSGDAGQIFCNRARVSGKPYDQLGQNPLPPDAARMHHTVPADHGKTSVIQHLRDFFHCVVTREQPITTIESAHRTATTLHLANISIRLGRPIQFDPDLEQVIDDDEATSMLSRQRRPPFLL